MRILALNIETIPNLDLLDQLPDPELRLGNTKDPAKIKAKQDEAREKAAGRMALDPYFGKVLCVTLAMRPTAPDGVVPHDVEPIKSTTVFTTEHGEVKVLKWVWRQLAEPETQLVTFNGATFDIPFLQTRSMLNRVAPALIETNKYKVLNPHGSHCDLMALLHGDNGNPLGIPRTLPFYVKQILGRDWPYADLDQSNLNVVEPDTVKQLCEWNAAHTLLLHEVARTYLP